MIKKIVSAIPFFYFKNLLPFNHLLHAISTRNGGYSAPPYQTLNLGIDTGDDTEALLNNYRTVSGALKFELSLLVASRQVHGAQVMCVSKEHATLCQSPLFLPLMGYDALITDEPFITLMVRVADCVPVILFDPFQQVAAVAHAGWRGTLAGIAEKTVTVMMDRYHCLPEHILAGIGPSIGPCCCEVQREVAKLFSSKKIDMNSCIQEKDNSLFLNLWEANRRQLMMLGIPGGNIEVARVCTACRTDLFFSHRREQGKTGRFGAFVGLRK